MYASGLKQTLAVPIDNLLKPVVAEGALVALDQGPTSAFILSGNYRRKTI